MEFEKSITLEELAKIYDEIRVKFGQSDERIDAAAELTGAAAKTAGDTIKELLDIISMLNDDTRTQVAIKLQKIVAAVYLSAAAEIINDKQKINDGSVAYRLASKYIK